MERLEEIKQRERAATPGPWTVQFDDLDLTGIRVANGKKMTEDDIWFIGHSPRDIPWLIAEVERLRAENERLKDGKTQKNPVKH